MNEECTSLSGMKKNMKIRRSGRKTMHEQIGRTIALIVNDGLELWDMTMGE